MRDSVVAEKNKEIMRLIGRRLREASAGADEELPPAILSGLERLSALQLAAGARAHPQLPQQAEAAAQPPCE
jgi:hypothetical protein